MIMRKKSKLTVTENMFGRSFELKCGDQVHTLVTNQQDGQWLRKGNLGTANYWWFRAPSISVEQLGQTVRSLAHMQHAFEFHVWYTDNKLDASIKISDEIDAATFAWSHTEMWMKWSTQAEAELSKGRRPTPALKATVDKNGKVRVRGQVTVTSMPSDPD
jgi:hypothetical protein